MAAILGSIASMALPSLINWGVKKFGGTTLGSKILRPENLSTIGKLAGKVGGMVSSAISRRNNEPMEE
jgi:hypothetical protein